MSAISKYLADALLNAAFRNISFSSPTTVYVALYTSDPGDLGTGTEVSGGSYARRAVTFGAPTDVNGKSTIKNTADVEFPVATGNWGTISHIGIRTALTAGNLLWYGPAATSKLIESGDQYKILTDNLVIDLD